MFVSTFYPVLHGMDVHLSTVVLYSTVVLKSVLYFWWFLYFMSTSLTNTNHIIHCILHTIISLLCILYFPDCIYDSTHFTKETSFVLTNQNHSCALLHLKVPVCKSGHAFQASNMPGADFTQSRSSCVLIEILIEAGSGVTILFISKIKSEQTAAESY